MLSQRLNERIQDEIKKARLSYLVKDMAPASFPELCASGALIVWSGASEDTIYGSAAVNHMFRAWHDSLHLKLGADFSLAGETIVGLEQARILGGGLGDIVMAEVVGQVEYLLKYGTFPVDQKQFVISYLKLKKV